MRRKALKARFGREANFLEREAMVPRKLARANRETNFYRVKCKVTTCLKSKEKPACDFPREAIVEPSKKRKARKICTSCKISNTREKREYKNSLKPVCDFSYEAIAKPAYDFPPEADIEPSRKRKANDTCEKCKTFYTRERRDDKNSLQPAFDSPCKVNTEPSNNSEASNTCEKCKILCKNCENGWQIIVNRKNRSRRE